jgi:hypothetical protein
MSLPYLQPYLGLSNGLNTLHAAGGGGAGGIGGWVEVGRTTLGGSADTISVSSLPDKRYYMILCDLIQTGGNIRSATRLNGDTGSNYSVRDSEVGAADSTATSQTYMKNSGSNGYSGFNVGYLANYSSKEKLLLNTYNGANASGAGNAPAIHESVGKWANTSNPVSTIAQYNDQAGDFASGSSVVVLGFDPADSHTNNYWEELASVELGSAGDNLSSGTFTAKKYLWVQVFTKSSGTNNHAIRFNGDSGTNYAYRRNLDGGSFSAEINSSNDASISMSSLGGFNLFANIFIMNPASREKQHISHTVFQNTAGASNAPRRREAVGKWTNTSNQITSILVYNNETGDYDTGSFIKVWGAD